MAPADDGPSADGHTGCASGLYRCLGACEAHALGSIAHAHGLIVSGLSCLNISEQIQHTTPRAAIHSCIAKTFSALNFKPRSGSRTHVFHRGTMHAHPKCRVARDIYQGIAAKTRRHQHLYFNVQLPCSSPAYRSVLAGCYSTVPTLEDAARRSRPYLKARTRLLSSVRDV